MGAQYREAFGAPYYGAHRVALLRVLAAAVGRGVVRHGRRCVAVTPDAGGEARIELEDGETEAADVVVGADGVHSVVRGALGNGRPAVYSGTVGYRGLVPVDALPSLPDSAPLQFWAGPRAHLLHYSIEGGSIVNFLAVVRQREWASAAWNEPCDVADALAPFAGWHPAVTEMVGAVAEGSPLGAARSRAARALERRARRAHRRRRARDAAPPGQGANQTIEDAVLLADLLAGAGRDDVVAALARYEALRRPRTRRVQRWSRLAADWMHLPDGPAAERRDARLPSADADLAWIHGYDVRDPAAVAAA